MKISILIPSKDRIELLRLAVDSILRQRDRDFEIVICDNASGEDYASYVHSLNDERIVYYRQTTPVSVTDNWRKAWSIASGEYVLMLGDDDALAPNFFTDVRKHLEFDRPDLVFLSAYHYAYPGAIEQMPNGYLAIVQNSEFLHDCIGPFCLTTNYAQNLARSVLQFNLKLGLNAQHYLLNRAFCDRFEVIGGIYQSPYPDYFAATILFTYARHILVLPKETVIIGISPKSFGSFYFSGRQKEGFDFLANRQVLIDEAIRGDILPGDEHNTNWLLAAAAAERLVGRALQCRVDIDRYRIIQLVAVLKQRYLHQRYANSLFSEFEARLNAKELAFLNLLALSCELFAQKDPSQLPEMFALFDSSLTQHLPARVFWLDIGPHQTVGDAIDWLIMNSNHSSEEDRFRHDATPASARKSPLTRYDTLQSSSNSNYSRSVDQLSSQLEAIVTERDTLARERDHILRRPLYFSVRRQVAKLPRLMQALVALRAQMKGVPPHVISLGNNGIYFCVDQPVIGQFAFLPAGRLTVSGWAVDILARRALRVRARLNDRVYVPNPKLRLDVQQQLRGAPPESGFEQIVAFGPGLHGLIVEVEAAPEEWQQIFHSMVLSLGFRVPHFLNPHCAKRLFVALRSRLSASRNGRSLMGKDGIYFHVDKPAIGRFALISAQTFVVSGWAADIKAESVLNVRIRLDDRVFIPHRKLRPDVRQTLSGAPTECGFEQLVDMTPGLHRLIIEIESAPGDWREIFSSIIACWRLGTGPWLDPITYRQWIGIEQRFDCMELAALKRHSEIMLVRPHFVIIIYGQNSDDIENTLGSIRAQIYRDWTTHVVDGIPKAQFLISYLERFDGGYVVFIRAGSKLSRRALYEFASAINAWPEMDMLYGDSDELGDSDERLNPFFKPDWSPDYLEAYNYIGESACFRISVAKTITDSASNYDFILKFTERSQKIYHIRKILCHSRKSLADADERGGDLEALRGRLRRTGRRGMVNNLTAHDCAFDIALTLNKEPLVSVIVPTAGKIVDVEGRKLDLVSNIVAQIHEHSTYKNIEIVIVDNGDLSTSQIALIEKYGCRRITFHEAQFNVAKKINLGTSIANGEMLLIINDDIEVITPRWIERMLEHFEKPHVGVVGAKLLYPDNRIQHAGVVINGGNPDHVRRLYPREDHGYFFSTSVARNFTAVTGACMLTSADIFGRANGYTEALAVSYNDTDYCLKVARLGYYTVYAPQAELYHLESKSRVASLDIEEADYFHRKWAVETVSDKFYNERFLTVASPTFEPQVNRRLI